MMQERQILTLTSEIGIEIQLGGTDHEETILFIPGLGANISQFANQMAHFSRTYRTLGVSLRGHGRSTAPSSGGAAAFTLETLAGDMLQVLDRLDIPAAHIVGNSTGGLVAYAMLKQAPGVVRSLTTFGTAAELHTGSTGAFVVFLDRVLGPTIEAWLAKRTVSKQPAVAAHVADMIRSTPKATIVNLRSNLLDYNYLPVLTAHPDVPMLIIQGQYDNEINKVLSSTLNALREQERVQVAHLDGAGHFANLDQPDKFNQLLEQFLL